MYPVAQSMGIFGYGISFESSASCSITDSAIINTLQRGGEGGINLIIVNGQGSIQRTLLCNGASIDFWTNKLTTADLVSTTCDKTNNVNVECRYKCNECSTHVGGSNQYLFRRIDSMKYQVSKCTLRLK